MISLFHQWCCCLGCSSYDQLQCFAVWFLYLQIVCAVVGSLGASYGGLSSANLAVALFALVAVESGSQSLGRTYAVLLACILLLDISWFVLFSHEIWEIAKDPNVGTSYKISVGTVFSMQVVGFALRFVSSFFWIQIYRLGASKDLSEMYQHVDFSGAGNLNFLTPLASPAPSRQVSVKEDVAGGSIYNPANYYSVFGKLSEDSNEITEERLLEEGRGADDRPSAVKTLFT